MGLRSRGVIKDYDALVYFCTFNDSLAVLQLFSIVKIDNYLYLQTTCLRQIYNNKVHASISCGFLVSK